MEIAVLAKISGHGPHAQVKPARPAPVLRLRCGAKHLHALGARGVGEFLAELGRAHGIEEAILDCLDRWRAEITAEMVQAVGGDTFPPMLREVPR